MMAGTKAHPPESETLKTNRTHLFLASFPASRGEITLALRVAHDLHEQGDRIVFLICKTDAAIFSGKAFEFVVIDSLTPLDNHLTELVQKYKADSLLLVDLHSNSVWLQSTYQGKWFFEQKLVPVLALDIYHLFNARLRGDVFVDQEWDLSYLSFIPQARISPVPLISPDACGDVYNSLPPSVEVEEHRKKEIRKELGIGETEKLILVVGAQWQAPAEWKNIHARRMAIFIPTLITYYVSRIDAQVRVVHIGPQPYHIHKNLSGRYLWLNQVDQQHFYALLSSADLFLTPNVVGTTLSTVLSVGLPMVVIKNSVNAKTVDEALSKIPGKASDELMKWLSANVPVFPHQAWPLGYYNLVARLFENNPFCETFLNVELFHEDAVIEACTKLLFDENERRAILEKQAQYVSRVRSLPRGADLINRHLSAI
jgi:hypothetical protein